MVDDFSVKNKVKNIYNCCCGMYNAYGCGIIKQKKVYLRKRNEFKNIISRMAGTMKYKILILTIILLLFTTAVSAQEKPIANAENILQISIGSTSMFMDQHEKYNLNIYYPETKYCLQN